MLRVALVVNPTNDLPGTEVEADAVETILNRFSDQISLTKLNGNHATRVEVKKLLSTSDVFHYCGHAFFDGPGETESGLELASNERLTLRDIRELDSVPRVVFFNACESARVRGNEVALRGASDTPGYQAAAFAEIILRAGVDAYLGTYWQVTDSAAAKFASTVYTNLASGQSLEKAVRDSRRMLWETDENDWANYLFYGNGAFKLHR